MREVSSYNDVVKRVTEATFLFLLPTNKYNHNMSWRTIDIDQYDEDAYTEDEILADFETGLSAEEVASATQTRSTDVRNMLTR